MTGLRERKRARTKETIASVALDLFDRQGFQATTIPQIAEAADVSPRTVSAYFPHKEDIAFPDKEEVFSSLETRLRDRPAGERTVTAMRDWIGYWVREQAGREHQHRRLRRVIDADEGLRAYERRLLVRAQDCLTAAIARDLGVGPDGLEPRMAAAATMTVFELLGEAFEPTGVDRIDDVLAGIDRALLFIDAGVSALSSAQP